MFSLDLLQWFFFLKIKEGAHKHEKISQKTKKKVSFILHYIYNENYIMELNLIQSTLSINLCGGMPFVKGSAIINSKLICSMTIFFCLTHYLMAKYLMSMCLPRLPLLLFLEIKTAAK